MNKAAKDPTINSKPLRRTLEAAPVGALVDAGEAPDGAEAGGAAPDGAAPDGAGPAGAPDGAGPPGAGAPDGAGPPGAGAPDGDASGAPDGAGPLGLGPGAPDGAGPCWSVLSGLTEKYKLFKLKKYRNKNIEISKFTRIINLRLLSKDTSKKNAYDKEDKCILSDIHFV
ncbi:2209_t:CDS:2 [Cetraspora pellucida]|uniref:2209_t:CDS:1 n=1 Tax=Cetraspora pellucida TaxID=1433469 RepID=A0A9N9GFM0_9GLOM|nr:2209_t:CDS:2 [Cetraspora pellucida]